MFTKPETSIHAVDFTEESTNSSSAQMDVFFINCQVAYLNDLLKMRGHVFLNEVYDCLGVERTEAGQLLGWWNDDDETIDFTVMNLDGHMIIDFNVDKEIAYKLAKSKKESNEQGSNSR